MVLMSMIDIDSLLREISPEAPCGEDLAYDPAYLELDGIISKGAPEGIVAGAATTEQEGPNWREVRTRCLDLFKRSKDLRIAMDLSLALLMDGGIAGLRDGLAVIRGFVEKYWDSVFPKLDPEDNNDPLERMNIIGSLASPPGAYKDPMMFCKRVREAPLCKSARLGAFSLRDIEAAGETAGQAAEGASRPTAAVIAGAFEDTPSEELLATAKTIDEAVEHVRAIEDKLTALVGAGRAPNLSGLRDDALGKVRSGLHGFLVKRGLAAGGAGAVEAAPGTAGAQAGGGGAALSGEVRSPQDVVAALDKVCQYYERNEPSSPVPLLLRRAQRLVSKNYVEIVQDLTPEVWEQIRRLGGIDNLPGGA
jgi:type VI secretion system protein ImpA